MTRLALCLVLIAGVTACVVSPRAGASPESVSCPVTVPTRSVPPDAGSTPAAFNHGGASLRVHLYWSNGTLVAGLLPGGGSNATVAPNGSIAAKLGWWRGVPGKLRIVGRRLDAPAARLRAHVPAGYGARGFQPSGVSFPSAGCWRVTGAVEGSTLSFVVRVRRT